MRFTPLVPASRARQKASLPMPLGLTEPMPVMTTRFNMRSYNRETTPVPLGLYISVPFCRQKCTFCNFASGVFSPAKMQAYVDRVCDDISHAGVTVDRIGGRLDDRNIDSVYLGGGTPTVLAPQQMAQ